MRESGSSGSSIETAEKSTSGLYLDVREMEEVVVLLWFRVSGVIMVSHCCFILDRSGGEVSNLSGNGRIDDENEP